MQHTIFTKLNANSRIHWFRISRYHFTSSIVNKQHFKKDYSDVKNKSFKQFLKRFDMLYHRCKNNHAMRQLGGSRRRRVMSCNRKWQELLTAGTSSLLTSSTARLSLISARFWASSTVIRTCRSSFKCSQLGFPRFCSSWKNTTRTLTN